MSFPQASVTVAGVPARVYLSEDVLQSHLSGHFVHAHFPQKSHCSDIEITVSTCLQLTSLTCVIQFVIDPCLSSCDAVLGLDWIRQCQISEMWPLTMSIARLDKLGV